MRYPEQLDAAINAALARLPPGRKKPKHGAGPSCASSPAPNPGEPASMRRRLLAALQESLGAGSARAPLADTGLTLAAAVDSHSAGVRLVVRSTGGIVAPF